MNTMEMLEQKLVEALVHNSDLRAKLARSERMRKFQYRQAQEEKEAILQYACEHKQGYCKCCYQLIPYGSTTCPNCN